MTLAVTAEQHDLHRTVQAFASRRITESEIRTAVEAETETLPSCWANLAELGLLSVHLPEDVGGAGLGIAELAVVTEALGHALAPGPFLPTVITSAILTAAGHRPHLAGLGDGTLVGATVISPVAGTLLDDGSVHVVGGPVVVMSGQLAQVFVLPVTCDDDRIRWVVMDAQNCRITPVTSVDLTRRVATVAFDGIVSANDVLDIDMWRPWDTISTLFGAEAAGLAGWATNTAAEYAKVREQFGRPIGEFQGVKHRVAWMLARTEAGRACAWDAANALDEGSREANLMACVAAATSVEAGFSTAKDLVQTLGGIGFTWEHVAGFYLRRAHSLRLTLGSESHCQQRVARLAQSGLRRTLRLELPAEVEAERERIRAEIAPAVNLPAEEQRRYLAEHGYTQPSLPEPYGKGADGARQLLIAEEVEAASVTPVDMVIGTWVMPVLLQWGSDAQRERFLPASLRGDLSWCQLFSEPEAGSDLASLRTRAERVEGGWRVTGQKVWTSMPTPPDHAILLARTDPEVPKHRGLSFFIVDMTAPGITVRPLRELTGEALFNEVFLDDVFVPDDMIVGAPGDGWRVARSTLSNERASMSKLGSMGEGLEQLIELTRGRDDFETLTKIGALVCESLANRLLTLRETIRAIAGGEPGAGSSIAKLLAGGHAQRVWETSCEMLGHQALVRPDDGGRDAMWYFLNSRCLTIAGGTTDVQLNIIAERILGLPRDPEPAARK